jgi:hypothetical protein
MRTLGGAVFGGRQGWSRFGGGLPEAFLADSVVVLVWSTRLSWWSCDMVSGSVKDVSWLVRPSRRIVNPQAPGADTDL